MSERLVRITAPHFVAGVVIEPVNGVATVVAAAPILKYTRGWTVARLRDYIRKKGWSAEWV